MAAADLDFPFEMLPTRQASERVTFCGRICVFPLARPSFGQYILFVDVCYATLYRQAGGNSSELASVPDPVAFAGTSAGFHHL